MNLLLYEPLPLRTTRVLGDFAEDSVLAHVFGDLTASRFKLTRISDTRGHAADHAMEITGAGSGTTPTDSWTAKIEDDGTGHVCTFVDFLAPVDAADEMWAYGRGKRNSITDALIENPGALMEAVSALGYRSDRFQQAREECAGIRLAGRIAAGPAIGTTAATSIRASIDTPAMSAGIMWCAGMARRYPAPVGSSYVILLDQDKTSLRADLSAAVDDTADILRCAYDFCDVTGKPAKYIELTASPQRYGGLVRELALPMLRTPADAEAVCTPILQRFACERYDVQLAIERTDIRPGQWLKLNLAKFAAWPFSGADPYLMAIAVNINKSTGTTDVDCEWMRTTPAVTVTAHSLALPDTFAGDVEIASGVGIATFTVFDDAHRGLQGARVSLDGGEPKTTDDRGQVSFAYVPGKTYQITIEAPGRGTATIFQTLGS